MNREFKAKNEEMTRRIGEEIGHSSKGCVIAFYGDLGAGKTTMTKGIAKGLSIEDMISSPTFAILHSYESGRLPLHHLDCYRIEDEDEMEEIGLDDCIYGGGITVIEWAENIEGLLPDDTVSIVISTDGESKRTISIDDPKGVLLPLMEI